MLTLRHLLPLLCHPRGGGDPEKYSHNIKVTYYYLKELDPRLREDDTDVVIQDFDHAPSGLRQMIGNFI